MNAHGTVHKYGDSVDTDVIIPARYLNTASHQELAAHCMEDIDKEFVHKVKPGDIIVANKNFGCGSSRGTRSHCHQGKRDFLCDCQHLRPDFFTETPLTLGWLFWNVTRRPETFGTATR